MKDERFGGGGDGRLERLNVFGEPLAVCSERPLTGYWRNGCCDAGPEDRGLHIVCVRVTAGFLEFSKARGNDLSTPAPDWNFPGLKPGDHWCLCALRWREAFDAGKAPPVMLRATHQAVLQLIRLQDLQQHALDPG